MEKYLVAASGDIMESKVSGRFGHSGYYLIIDPQTSGFHAIRGIGKDDPQRIGEIITPDIRKAIVGNIGP
ncbi:MAG: hypothetical protein JW973_11115 [Bacteroidales bacterium]|nr:hypothetical protein [Bacteroidales bacterium]MBN2699562.1 hypothetical protein [Bacteroidales bacterium]